ncbi:hypothetical protein [Streptomyces sp. AC154]|uniref:hypothetical protein n=1 Tax=Streptomyces sp. AC154 TaxID=3143184 RepID=UPI003F7E2BFC
MSEIENPPASGSPTFDVRVDASHNVVIGTQSRFTQNYAPEVDSQTLTQVMEFAARSRQERHEISLTEEQQSNIEELAGEVESEVGGQRPERGRLRDLTNQLISTLTPAAGTVLGQGLITAGNEALHALGG